MRNEKGLTLVEIMAAVAISGFLIVVATMMFSSIQLEWNSTNNKYQLDAEIRRTMNAVTKYVADSNQAYLTNNELRFITYADGAPKKKVIYFDSSEKKLILYDFISASLQDNVVMSSTVYTNGVVLADKVKMMSFQDINNNDMTSSLPIPVAGGSIIKLSITFEYARATVNGSTPTPITKTTSIKLLQS